MKVLENELRKIFLDHPEILKNVVKEIIDDKLIELNNRLDSKKAAKYLNISVKTLDNKCSLGEINYYRVGKKREFEYDDLKHYKSLKEKKIVSFK